MAGAGDDGSAHRPWLGHGQLGGPRGRQCARARPLAGKGRRLRHKRFFLGHNDAAHAAVRAHPRARLAERAARPRHCQRRLAAGGGGHLALGGAAPGGAGCRRRGKAAELAVRRCEIPLLVVQRGGVLRGIFRARDIDAHFCPGGAGHTASGELVDLHRPGRRLVSDGVALGQGGAGMRWPLVRDGLVHGSQWHSDRTLGVHVGPALTRNLGCAARVHHGACDIVDVCLLVGLVWRRALGTKPRYFSRGRRHWFARRAACFGCAGGSRGFRSIARLGWGVRRVREHLFVAFALLLPLRRGSWRHRRGRPPRCTGRRECLLRWQGHRRWRSVADDPPVREVVGL
mmetsp:Transcript_88308/g.270244  ORF Transcript_88308/g.270244 Transcript_88308/m.270244 type:complete len:343 (-) Transcript_88308:74-1102(-)